jgi:hypothetical protein
MQQLKLGLGISFALAFGWALVKTYVKVDQHDALRHQEQCTDSDGKPKICTSYDIFMGLGPEQKGKK